MAESSLSFAREEAAQEQRRLVDIGALTSSVCEDLADTGLDVTCADTGRFAVPCRPVGMKRALAEYYRKRCRLRPSRERLGRMQGGRWP